MNTLPSEPPIARLAAYCSDAPLENVHTALARVQRACDEYDTVHVTNAEAYVDYLGTRLLALYGATSRVLDNVITQHQEVSPSDVNYLLKVFQRSRQSIAELAQNTQALARKMSATKQQLKKTYQEHYNTLDHATGRYALRALSDDEQKAANDAVVDIMNTEIAEHAYSAFLLKLANSCTAIEKRYGWKPALHIDLENLV